MRKALIFDPYLDTLGGGERYSLTFALACHLKDYAVEIAWPNDKIFSEAKSRFGLDISFAKTNPAAYNFFTSSTNIISKFFFTRKYNLIFWLSDGSIPFLFSQNNILHFQYPFSSLRLNPVAKNKLKFI